MIQPARKKNDSPRQNRTMQGKQESRPAFKKKERRLPDRRLYSPADGMLISLADLRQPEYAQKLYGDGIAVVPDGDLIVSPCSGTVVMIPWTKQAIGIEADNGDQILLHIGVNTAIFNGRGMDFQIQEGSKVKIGTPLVKLDRRYFSLANADLTIFMIITNRKVGDYSIIEGDAAAAGKTPVMERKQ